MKFFKTIKDSVYGPVFYQKIVAGQVPFNASVRYGLKLLLTVSAVMWLLMVLFLGGLLYFGSKVILPEVVKRYPAGLEVSIKDGVVTTNVPSPYMIPFDATDLPEMVASTTVANVLVIDTTSEASYEKFLEYKTMALLTKEQLLYTDQDGTVSIVPLTKVPDITINEDLVTTWYPKIEMFIKGAFAVLVVLLLPIIFAGTVIYYGLYLLLAGLFVYGLTKLMKIAVSYQQSYQLAIHAVTLPVIVSMVAFLVPMIQFPFLTTLLVLVIVGFNLMKK